MKKFIFVTGGVVSGLGKGIAAASIGNLLKARGLKIAVEKFDPYLNVDPGTMSPYQHGEVFVTEDGAETDLDLGHYERFIDIPLFKESSLSSGQVYNELIKKERKGEYLGGTVQMVPHVTELIKSKIRNFADKTDADVIITEIGGTIGDIEGDIFVEAIRQFKNETGKENTLFIHLTLIPYLRASKELKTKPTQHSVKMLQSRGIQPDILLCRTEMHLPEALKEKIGTFCDIDSTAVFEALDMDTIYEIPLSYKALGIDKKVCEILNIETSVEPNLEVWEKMVNNYKSPKKIVKIAIVGKYVELEDAYISVVESLKHAGAFCDSKVDIKWVNSEILEQNDNVNDVLKDVDGILVPGGFGNRGIEGKILAAKYARENNVPYLGICLGMQIAVIEFARNVLGYKDANSSEIDLNTTHKVIDIMEHQRGITTKGGTMRLGAYNCKLKKNTKAYNSYGTTDISERHRHRYEFNNEYRKKMEEKGMVFAGTSPDDLLVEIIELKDHPWFVATQAHPEFKSRLNKPHPLFRDFVLAALKEI